MARIKKMYATTVTATVRASNLVCASGQSGGVDVAPDRPRKGFEWGIIESIQTHDRLFRSAEFRLVVRDLSLDCLLLPEL